MIDTDQHIGWTTQAYLDAPDDDSAAPAIFNTWMHFFIERAIKDELDALDFDVWRLDGDPLARTAYAKLTDPKSFVTSPVTQRPILCDNHGAAGPDDSCTKVILQAMVDAITHLPAMTDADPSGYLANQYVDAPYLIEAIVRAGELRWMFHGWS